MFEWLKLRIGTSGQNGVSNKQITYYLQIKKIHFDTVKLQKHIGEKPATNLFVARHDNDLDLTVHDHPPELLHGVWKGPLAGDVSIAAARTLVFK